MKRIFTIMLIMLVSTFTFTSCSTDTHEDLTPKGLKGDVTLTANLEGIKHNVTLKSTGVTDVPSNIVKVIIKWVGTDIKGLPLTGYSIQDVTIGTEAIWNFKLDKGTYKMYFKGYDANDPNMNNFPVTDADCENFFNDNKFTYYGIKDEVIHAKDEVREVVNIGMTTMYRMESMLSQDFRALMYGYDPVSPYATNSTDGAVIIPDNYEWTFKTQVWKRQLDFVSMDAAAIADLYIGSSDAGYYLYDVYTASEYSLETFTVKVTNSGVSVTNGDGGVVDALDYMTYTSDNTTGCIDMTYKLVYKKGNGNSYGNAVEIISGSIKKENVTSTSPAECATNCEEHENVYCLPYYKLRINHILRLKVNPDIYNLTNTYEGTLDWVNLTDHDVDIDIPTN